MCVTSVDCSCCEEWWFHHVCPSDGARSHPSKRINEGALGQQAAVIWPLGVSGCGACPPVHALDSLKRMCRLDIVTL